MAGCDRSVGMIDFGIVKPDRKGASSFRCIFSRKDELVSMSFGSILDSVFFSRSLIQMRDEF